jgi:peptidyl-prolyl cis-trans isomerase SurA
MKKITLVLAAFIASQLLFCQSNSHVLLTIDNSEITKNEFLRIYNKNSNIETGDKKSIDEYLELFINYKLKVIEAEHLGYDTLNSFIKEMNGYRDQLSKPYLENNLVYDSLAKEAYARQLKDVNFSQILIKIGRNALPKDTLEAYNKTLAIRERILAGEIFDEVARATSDEPWVKQKGGNFGWYNVFQLPYQLESVCYSIPVGQLSMPVRTSYGYHIVKVNGYRKNQGEVLISHIMTIFPRNATDQDKQAAKQKIEKAYDKLQQGEPWINVVNNYSEHKATISKGGSLGWQKTGTIPQEIIDTCFLLDSGKYSRPFMSSFGYHIVKVDGFKPVPSFEEAKEQIEQKIKSIQELNEIAENQTISRIKQEYGYKVYDDNIKVLFSLVDSSIYYGNWNYTAYKNYTAPVFLIGDKEYSQYDIIESIGIRKYKMQKNTQQAIVESGIDNFSRAKVLEYEKEQLPSKYPELKNLLDEYHDGILLFNLTEDKVWKKAVEDTIGLENYYNQLSEKYYWEPRVKTAKYIYTDSSLTETLLSLAKKRTEEGDTTGQLIALLCPKDAIPCISLTELKYEKNDNSIADSINWSPGAYLTSKINDKYILYYVERILPVEIKNLKEARGLYIADYQSYLEKQWIQELRNKYTIIIDKKVLKKIKQNEK